MMKEKNMKNARNKFIVLGALMMFLVLPMRAQVFLMEEDMESNIRVVGSEFVVPAPYQGGDLDQYLPLGDGLILLTSFGGAYLLKKGRKRKKAD